MWDRRLIKGNAKRVLSRNYWIPFFVCLIVVLLSGNFDIGSFSGNVKFQIDVNNMDVSSYIAMFLPVSVPFYLIVFGLSLAIVISLFLTIFVFNPLRVGKARYFLKNIEEQAEIGELFKVFTEPNYLNIVKIMFLHDVKIVLWTLCLLIPGFVKSLEYTCVPYLLAEDSGMSSREVFAQSKEMTNGDKFDIFVLHMSFLGWLLLGSFAFSIGVIFVDPYMEATYAELYYCLKEKMSY